MSDQPGSDYDFRRCDHSIFKGILSGETGVSDGNACSGGEFLPGGNLPGAGRGRCGGDRI